MRSLFLVDRLGVGAFISGFVGGCSTLFPGIDAGILFLKNRQNSATLYLYIVAPVWADVGYHTINLPALRITILYSHMRPDINVGFH